MFRNRIAFVAVLVLFSAVVDAQTRRPADRWRGAAPRVFSAPSRVEPRYGIVDDPTAYGLAAGQGVANAQIVLARKGDGGVAGQVVAKRVSSAGGGVTFENVPPGQYVVTITVARVVAAQFASNRSPYRPVKSFFESRSNIATITISGQEWRSFENVPYVFAVRPVSLTNQPAEVRVDQYATVIAQQFVVPDGSAVTIQAAIGLRNPAC